MFHESHILELNYISNVVSSKISMCFYMFMCICLCACMISLVKYSLYQFKFLMLLQFFLITWKTVN